MISEPSVIRVLVGYLSQPYIDIPILRVVFKPIMGTSCTKYGTVPILYQVWYLDQPLNTDNRVESQTL